MKRFLPLIVVIMLVYSCKKDTDKQVTPTYSTTDSLSWRPFKPTDINLFSSKSYPAAKPYPLAVGSAITEQQGLQKLTDYMSVEPAAIRESALSFYNNPLAKKKIPSPFLRAGMAALKGTIGEDAITFVLDAKTPAGLAEIKEIILAVPPIATAIAQMVMDAVTKQKTIFVDPNYQFENPFVFTSVLLHETLHEGKGANGNTLMEEGNIQALEYLVYMQQLLKHPELAVIQTQMVQRTNINTLLRFNSGKGAELGLYESNRNGPIAPGSIRTWTSWYDQVTTSTDSKDPNPAGVLLKQVLERAKKPGGTAVPVSPQFDKATFDWIDRNANPFTETEMLKIARALKLDIIKP